MGITSLFNAQELPKTSADAIRIFDERYLAALSASPPPAWMTDFGEVVESESPDLSFPVSSLATKYRQTMGPSRSKYMLEGNIRVKTVEFDDGYEGKLLDITKNVFAYKQWAAAPARFMRAEARFRNFQIASLFTTATKSGYEASGGTPINFFGTTHRANFADPASATWSNYESVGKSVVSSTDISTEMTAMRGVLDENGDKLGIEPDTIFLQTTQFQNAVNFFKQDLIANAAGTATIRNPFFNPEARNGSKQKGLLQLVHIPEWTDSNSGLDWILGDSEMMKELPSFGAVKYMVPETLSLRYWDEASDYFKDTGNIKVSSHIFYGFTMLFPHAIRYVTGA